MEAQHRGNPLFPFCPGLSCFAFRGENPKSSAALLELQGHRVADNTQRVLSAGVLLGWKREKRSIVTCEHLIRTRARDRRRIDGERLQPRVWRRRRRAGEAAERASALLVNRTKKHGGCTSGYRSCFFPGQKAVAE